MSESAEPIPASSGLAASLTSEEFSVSEAIGGPRGVIESLVPGVVFVVTYVITSQLWWTVGLSAGVSILFVLIRLAQRTPVTQALAGLLGVGIGMIWAVSSGRAENYYAWGLITNAVYGAALLLSILVRQPLAAWAVRFLWSLPSGWTKDVHLRPLFRRSVAVTWVWVAVFALRLGVQAPLYFAGAVAPLGIAKLVMGLPLFALAAWFTWVLMRGMRPETADAAATAAEAEPDAV